MVGHPRAPSTRGTHLLRSRILAAELVVSAGVDCSHHVVEWGAGTGVLTAELAARAGSVEAIELDPALAGRLRDRFATVGHVRVVEGDALRVPLPDTPYRVVANVPFHATSALLRRVLDDPHCPMLRADVIVESGAAQKRTSTNLSSLRWAPWWELRLVRRVDRRSFRPPPSVDAAVLVATRRREPLVDDQRAWVSMLERAFTKADRPLRETMPHTSGSSRPIDLSLDDWLEVFRAARRRSTRGRGTSGSRSRRSRSSARSRTTARGPVRRP